MMQEQEAASRGVPGHGRRVSGGEGDRDTPSSQGFQGSAASARDGGRVPCEEGEKERSELTSTVYTTTARAVQFFFIFFSLMMV